MKSVTAAADGLDEVGHGMDRASRTAAAVEADHPGLEVEAWLSYDHRITLVSGSTRDQKS
jgi:hypothetical protein